MNIEYIIKKFNNKNPYFSCNINNGKSEIKFLTDNQLINHIAENIITELIFDVKNYSMNDKKISQKYLNIYAQLSKLLESINCFDYSDNNTSIIFITVDYLQFLINLMTEIIFNYEIDSNLCLCCGIDIGDNNPRQYCCKTYCPKHIISISMEEVDD